MGEDFIEAIFVFVAGFLQLRIVAVGEVLAEEEYAVGGEGLEEAGDEESDAPCREFRGAGADDEVEDEGHDELGGTAAEVAPAAGDTVGRSDDLRGEEGAHPELGGDEGGEGEAGEEAEEEEGGRGGGEGGAENGGGGGEDEGGGGQAGAEEVAGGPHSDSGEDGAGDGGDAGVADVGGGEVEVVADDGEERRRGEGGDEASEEGDPREVECAHVRRRGGE